VEQIRKEAFKEKEFSEEQYDQMMKMQSTQKGEDAPEKVRIFGEGTSVSKPTKP
jgi:hypothetical protein